MEFEKIIENIQNFGKNNASYWGTALAGETGEVCNLIKKFERDNKDISKDLPYELADVFIYTELTAQFFNIDLEKAILEKLEIIQYRTGKKLCFKCEKNKVENPENIFSNDPWRFMCKECRFDSQWG